MKLKIAFLQIESGLTILDNARLGEEALKKAASLGADVALFPEMWNCGYNLSGSQNEVNARAVRRSDGSTHLTNRLQSNQFFYIIDLWKN